MGTQFFRGREQNRRLSRNAWQKTRPTVVSPRAQSKDGVGSDKLCCLNSKHFVDAFLSVVLAVFCLKVLRSHKWLAIRLLLEKQFYYLTTRPSGLNMKLEWEWDILSLNPSPTIFLSPALAFSISIFVKTVRKIIQPDIKSEQSRKL